MSRSLKKGAFIDDHLLVKVQKLGRELKNQLKPGQGAR